MYLRGKLPTRSLGDVAPPPPDDGQSSPGNAAELDFTSTVSNVSPIMILLILALIIWALSED